MSRVGDVHENMKIIYQIHIFMYVIPPEIIYSVIISMLASKRSMKGGYNETT